MPKLRRLGATKTPLSEEKTTCPPTSISPCRGRSSPAIERSVVVLPQPLGPSRVNSSPSGTSNDTSCAALTAAPRSLAYSVNSARTLSTVRTSPAIAHHVSDGCVAPCAYSTFSPAALITGHHLAISALRK